MRKIYISVGGSRGYTQYLYISYNKSVVYTFNVYYIYRRYR